MTRTPRSPIREMEQLLERLAHPGVRGASPAEGAVHEAMTRADWAPAVDICERSREYLIKVELPEVPREDVRVTLNAGVLLIQGERKVPEDEDCKFHRIERSYGSFARSFALPDDVEEGAIEAECSEGVLSVRLPKHEQPKPKSVEVKVR